MVTILVVGFIAWALTGAVEDTIRSARGDAPRTERRGLRGYLDDRWKALADHHHAVAASGMLTAGDARQARKHLARTKALKFAGFATDEEVARAKAEHQHRLGFIAKGIDPDTMPPLFPVRGQVWEPDPDVAEPFIEAEPAPEPEPDGPGVSIDGHFYDNVQVWLNPEYFPPQPDELDTEPAADTQEKPWDPFAPINNDTKENTVSNTGEINSPADVKQFHDDLATVLGDTATLVDAFQARSVQLQNRVNDVKANIDATETAAAGMRQLGMTDAAAAADALMDIQGTVHDALLQLRLDHDTAVSALTDQASAAQAHLAAILAAHDGQLAVQDARAGAGHGNLADDTFLDND